MNKIKYILVLILLNAIIACSSSGKTQIKTNIPQQILAVTKSQQTKTLYFDGTVAPIQTKAVITPVDGVVTSMLFRYGQNVINNQLLVTITSSTLEKSYQQAVSDYLTAKEKYTLSKSSMVGAEDLYKSGITSLQTYQAAQSDLNDSYLSFLQAQQSIIQIIKATGLSQKQIDVLEINEEAEVKKAIEIPLKAIKVYANMSGIALVPISSSSGEGSSTSQPIHVGDQVKQGQTVVIIGNMNGIQIEIDVDEISINNIKIGDKVIITGPGFPGISLHGSVIAVSSQASSGSQSSSGLSTFPVIVAVNDISKSLQKLIHVGMSAKVQVNIASPEAIIVPIKAVHMNISDSTTYVNLIDPVSGKIVKRYVQTGSTTINGVTIISGLQEGDKIVIGN